MGGVSGVKRHVIHAAVLLCCKKALISWMLEMRGSERSERIVKGSHEAVFKGHIKLSPLGFDHGMELRLEDPTTR